MIQEMVNLIRQINSYVGNDDVQELLYSHNQEQTIDKLIKMHEQVQDIEELEYLDPVQSENHMTVGNFT
ncbi:hypothetical protein TNCV_4204861 [Trichonephila clavipes]|nr:hypothetical protein TNCV_4204861 [Trichonephila clavipes]